MLRAFLSFAFVLLSTAAWALPQRDPRTPLALFDANVERGGTYESGELMVRLEPKVSREALQNWARTLGCSVESKVGRRPLYLVRCARTRPVRALIEAWSKVSGVAWVEAAFHDDVLEAAPNDLADLQWYHQNTGQTVDRVRGTPGADMSSVRAWDVSVGGPETKLAIIDVGLYPAHQDLANRIWTNPGEICGNGRDDDDNGYVDDCRGWDFGESDPDPSPLSLPEMRGDGSPCLNWHATFIAGLAGAEGNNGIGVAGTAWNASLMNLKRHIDDTCRSTTTRTVAAIAYALDAGADALGMSFSSTSYSMEFEDILEEAELRGVITVMSAGNGGGNIDMEDDRWPNNYAIREKLIVASTDNRDRLDPGSNYGPQKVHLAAPGTYVLTTAIGARDAYGAGTGTSMSVGFVLGAIALTKNAFPLLSGAETRLAILEGSRPVRTLDCATSSRCVQSGKRLDLLGMLQAASQRFPAQLSLTGVTLEEVGDNDRLLEPGEQGRLVATVVNGGSGGAFAVKVTSSLGEEIPGVSMTSAEPVLGNIYAGSSAALERAVAPALVISSDCSSVEATPTLNVRVEDALGRTAEASFSVAIRCERAMERSADAGGQEPSAYAGNTTLAADAGVELQKDEPLAEEPGGCASIAGSPGASLGWGLLLVAALTLRPRR